MPVCFCLFFFFLQTNKQKHTHTNKTKQKQQQKLATLKTITLCADLLLVAPRSRPEEGNNGLMCLICMCYTSCAERCSCVEPDEQHGCL